MKYCFFEVIWLILLKILKKQEDLFVKLHCSTGLFPFRVSKWELDKDLYPISFDLVKKVKRYRLSVMQKNYFMINMKS